MLVFFGTRTLRIKRYTDATHYCPNCNHYDLEVNVYKDYFHIFFIPFVPSGPATAKLYCNHCRQPQRIDSVQRQYENLARTPFYLYAGTILFACLVLWMVYANMQTQKEKAKLVAAPLAGDVYLIRQDSGTKSAYYFLRVSQVNGDTVHLYHNTLVYGGFVTELNQDDYFDKTEELIYTKSALREMLNKDEINAVERSYGGSEGFNRVR